MDQTNRQFVEEERKRYREEGVLIYVTKKCCKECFFFSEAVVPSTVKENMLREVLEMETMVECLAVTVSERYGYTTPEASCCFGFYYNYLERIPMLQEAQQDGRIRFFDISHMPGVRESGCMLLSGKGYTTEKMIPIRRKREKHDGEEE